MSSIPETDLKQPRPLHYMFAHYALRNEAFLDSLLGSRLVNALRSQDRNYLKHQWFKAWAVSSHSGMRPDKDSLPFEEIRLYSVERDDIACHIIIMPEAKNMGEAIFVAVVEAPETNVRYFTLEKTYRKDGSPGTYFCEWQSPESHLNFGDGPDETIEAFVDRICQEVKA